MNKFSLQVLSPSGELFSGEVERVTAETKGGQITILAKHTPLVSVLDIGQLIREVDGEESRTVVAGGLIEVKPNGDVYILADDAKRSAEIDLAEAQKAKKTAAKRLKNIEDQGSDKFTEAEAKLKRNMAKLKAAKWQQSHSGS
jgi:F-type H+-transporting ATPase subunit epsilon